MKEASKGLLQFLRETQVGLASNEAVAQAERERREGIEDLDQEEARQGGIRTAACSLQRPESPGLRGRVGQG